MTTRIEGSSPVVSVPERTEHDAAPPPAAQAAPKSETNQLASWSSPAADAAASNIESSYGYGILPDMESISRDLGKLEGFALLKTLNKLDADGKLEDVLNRMTVDDRQKLINQAVKGNLLERKTPQDKLQPKFEMPTSFQKMVDELNVLQGKQKPTEAFTYNWSAYQEDAHDVAKRKFGNQISTLKAGESIEMDVKMNVSGELATAGGEAKVSVKRGPDGKFTVASEVSAEAGLHLKLGVDVDATLGAAGRVEYRFATAEEARAAADLFATSPAEAVAKYGRPSAIELKGKAGLDIATSFGASPVKLAKLKLSGDAQVSVRVELDAKKPALEVRVEGKVDGKAAQKIGLGPVSAEVRGIDGHLTGKVELELRTELEDPDAFLESPVDYVKANAAKLGGTAEAKLTVTGEVTATHHAASREVSVSTSSAELTRALSKMSGAGDLNELMLGLGDAAEATVIEKKSSLQHYGLDFKLDVGRGSVSGGAGYERKSVDSEKVLFRGSATQFAQAITS